MRLMLLAPIMETDHDPVGQRVFIHGEHLFPYGRKASILHFGDTLWISKSLSFHLGNTLLA